MNYVHEHYSNIKSMRRVNSTGLKKITEWNRSVIVKSLKRFINLPIGSI